MRRKDKLPELLAPAGDFECLVAAVAAGADAVYVGTKKFSARAFAKNFDIPDIDRAARYCHLFGVRLYVTLNTLLTTSELKEAIELARELYLLGVDALIVSDLGLVRELRRTLPELELHASTQMSVHNSSGADAAYEMGCSRVVLARELSLENMTLATENSLSETEVFVHGALCVSHSGQCLFSSLVGGRSGNRGECAQPCRLNYNGEKYPLSLKDLSLAMHIPSLIASGVASLKIEGRMKAPSYVYYVTRVYRSLLDGGRAATKDEMKLLERVFSRSGFTDGYFTGRLASMTGTRSDGDIAATKELKPPELREMRAPVTLRAVFRLGEPATLTLALKGSNRSVTVTGDVPSAAETHPLSKEELSLRLRKLGNTMFSLSEDDIELQLDGGINLSPSSINSLRRLAAEKLETFGRPESTKKWMPLFEREDNDNPSRLGRTAEFLVPELYFSLDKATRGYIDTVFLPLCGIESYESVTDGVVIPPVVTDTELPELRRLLTRAKARGVKYALVSNIGAVPEAKGAGLIPVAGFRMNVTNSYAKSALYGMGISDVTLSVELGSSAVSGMGGRAVVYGRIPLMLTERCFISESFGCDKCEDAEFEDRRRERFPILREWGHRNVILNSRPTYMGDKKSELMRRGTVSEHFIFSRETRGDAEIVLRAYMKGEKLPPDMQYRRMGRREPG